MAALTGGGLNRKGTDRGGVGATRAPCKSNDKLSAPTLSKPYNFFTGKKASVMAGFLLEKRHFVRYFLKPNEAWGVNVPNQTF
jgi:hypothetical protein